MAVVYQSDNACILSHEQYLNNIYSTVRMDLESDITCGFLIAAAFFQTSYGQQKEKTPGRNRKKPKKMQPEMAEEVQHLKRRFCRFMDQYAKETSSSTRSSDSEIVHHTEEIAYNFSDKVFQGSNNRPCCCAVNVDGQKFLFPPFSRYFNQNIGELRKFWDFTVKYDLVVLDPPWWNKYIKRLKKRATTKSYKLMSNEDLKAIPISEMIAKEAIVAVWCTNAESHLRDLRDYIFKAWNVVHITTWHWVKVSRTGEPICEFNPQPTGKQPFEKIVIGVRATASSELINRIDNDKLVISQPAAHHSHKPPLVELFKPLLPMESKCLELFARNLLPGFTSVGNEVLKFQNVAYFKSSTGENTTV